MKNFEASSFFGEKTRKHCFCEKVAQVIEKIHTQRGTKTTARIKAKRRCRSCCRPLSATTLEEKQSAATIWVFDKRRQKGSRPVGWPTVAMRGHKTQKQQKQT